MVSRFDRRFARSGFPRLLAEFGEPIVYRRRDGGILRFEAIISRSPPAFYGDDGSVVVPDLAIRFHNSCDLGLLSRDVDTGGDEVELLFDVNDLQKTIITVVKKNSQDSGVVSLALMGAKRQAPKQ